MAVRTPKYWETEDFQPLVEVETAYGNKVKIPQRLKYFWDGFQEYKEKVVPIFEQAIADGLHNKTSKKCISLDLRSVFVEKYIKEV